MSILYVAGNHRCESEDIHSGFSSILGVSVAVSVPEFRDSYRGAPGSGALVIPTPVISRRRKELLYLQSFC